MKWGTFWIIIFCLIPILLTAQDRDTSQVWIRQVETQMGYTSNEAVPLWMRSNQFGSVPAAGLSNSWVGSVYKTYRKPHDPNNFSNIDWGLDIQTRINVAAKTSAQLIEGTIKAKWWIFEGRAGRSKDIIGLNGDTTLSSGNFAVSGNALGIPKLEVRIPDYYRLPIFQGLISLKGNFAHGWVGKRLVDDKIFLVPSKDYLINSFYHQKSLYVRMGKEDSKLNLYGGINHQAYWGNEKHVYGNSFLLSDFKTFYYVLLGKAYSSPQIGSSKIGNQLGSIDLGISFDFDKIRLFGYRQNFYDVGAISKLANIRDGLNGLTIENLAFSKSKQSGVKWKKLLIEFFYSKDQAGYPWSIPTKSGDEDYYNNSYYLEGWSYKNSGVGSPLITAAADARIGQVSNPLKYFISNRVSAIHLGAELQAFKTNIFVKATYAKHYGTFSTSEWGGSTGKNFGVPFGLFIPVNQFSTYLKANHKLTQGYSLSLTLALDHGKLLDNSIGSYVSFTKQW